MEDNSSLLGIVGGYILRLRADMVKMTRASQIVDTTAVFDAG